LDSEADASDHTFPFELPKELLPYFTLNGTYEITRFLPDAVLRENQVDASEFVWGKEYMESIIAQVKDGSCNGTYGREATVLFERLCPNSQ
jgi:hypothetical protein